VSHIRSEDTVVVTQTGHIVEVQHMTIANHKATVRKLDALRYVVLSTGEVGYYEAKADSKAEALASLRRTFRRLRHLINNNFTGASNELFVTLTYAENMRDVERLYRDFEKYIKRLRYAWKDRSTIDYISVVEPQKRGAWHMHVLLRLNDLAAAYIGNADMAKLWGHGFVRVQRLEQVDNVGAYLTAYLTNLPTSKAKGKAKAYEKGARLHLYPPGMNFYRSSSGIRPPERVRMPYEAVKAITGACTPCYRRQIEVENGDFKTVITYTQYNLKRRAVKDAKATKAGL